MNGLDRAAGGQQNPRRQARRVRLGGGGKDGHGVCVGHGPWEPRVVCFFFFKVVFNGFVVVVKQFLFFLVVCNGFLIFLAVLSGF